jgi:NAD+ diphosphatase
MIQCIHPHCYDISFHRRSPRPEDFVLVSRGGEILFAGGEEGGFLPTWGELRAAYPDVDAEAVFLFSIDDERYFLLRGDLEERPGFAYSPMMSFRQLQPRRRAFGGVTAAHLAGWYGRNRFCGACGEPMTAKEDERAMVCPACGLTVYPTISPAVIVGVTDGDRLLLTRYPNRPARAYALIAGFMEVGESFEDTVRREVMEETGVRVKNIRYYKSQPWGFSSSVLAGFYADLDGPPDLTVDTNELAEAFWMSRGEIPEQDLGVAMTAEMIDAFRRDQYPA